MLSNLLIGWLSSGSQNLFSGKTDAGLTATAASPYFSSLALQVTAAGTSYNTYLEAKATAANGGRDAIAARNTAKATLLMLLRPLLSNINGLANGNADQLISSGFPMRKTTRTPIGNLPTPASPSVKPGPTDGTLKASTSALYGASSYTARVAPASTPTVYVQTVSQTSSRFMFHGLTSGELYHVEMSAMGAAGSTDWSGPGCCRPT